MFMPSSEIRKILSYLFSEGVLVCKADVDARHPQTGVSNLHVIQLMRSLESQDLIRRKFAWRHHYYFLKPDGVTYLRNYLHLPEDVVPLTHQRTGGAEEVRPPALIALSPSPPSSLIIFAPHCRPLRSSASAALGEVLARPTRRSDEATTAERHPLVPRLATPS